MPKLRQYQVQCYPTSKLSRSSSLTIWYLHNKATIQLLNARPQPATCFCVKYLATELHRLDILLHIYVAGESPELLLLTAFAPSLPTLSGRRRFTIQRVTLHPCCLCSSADGPCRHYYISAHNMSPLHFFDNTALAGTCRRLAKTARAMRARKVYWVERT